MHCQLIKSSCKQTAIFSGIPPIVKAATKDVFPVPLSPITTILRKRCSSRSINVRVDAAGRKYRMETKEGTQPAAPLLSHPQVPAPPLPPPHPPEPPIPPPIRQMTPSPLPSHGQHHSPPVPPPIRDLAAEENDSIVTMAISSSLEKVFVFLEINATLFSFVPGSLTLTHNFQTFQPVPVGYHQNAPKRNVGYKKS